MSQVRPDRIWQHNAVLPYILGGLRQKIEVITPVHKIYLTGSRARTAVAGWGLLEGKDWDIVVVCGFPIVNTHIWTWQLNYHIDLIVTSPDKAIIYLQNAIELYPHNKLEV